MLKKTIISFISWYLIVYLIGYLFYRNDVLTLRFALSTAIILGINFLIFNPRNMKKISDLINPPKRNTQE